MWTGYHDGNSFSFPNLTKLGAPNNLKRMMGRNNALSLFRPMGRDNITPGSLDIIFLHKQIVMFVNVLASQGY